MRYSRQDIGDSSRRILSSDSKVAADINKVAQAKQKPAWLPDAAKGLRQLAKLPEPAEAPTTEALAAPELELESIVQRVGRPVLGILNGSVDLNIDEPESAVWKNRLQQSAAALAPAIAAVGRIEATNWPLGGPYIGTGWLIDQGLIVTNRHVALEFAERGQTGFTFQVGFDRRSPVAVDIDFLEEIGNAAEAQFTISEIFFIANDTGPDVAFLKLQPSQIRQLAQPIKLSNQLLPSQTMVAVVGYPGRDPRVPDQDLMAKIFGNVFDKKRLAPGFLTGLQNNALMHDCTTLGGNSGSAVIDLLTGEAAALHSSGIFLKTNSAVPAPVVSTLLNRARQTAAMTVSTDSNTDMANPATSNNSNISGDSMPADKATIVIPLQITISVGTPTAASTAAQVSVGASAAAPSSAGADTSAARAATPPTGEAVAQAVAEARKLLSARADVISINPGYCITDGWITDERCVVVSVKKKLTPSELQAAGLTPIPASIGGIPTDVAVATVADRASYDLLEALEAARSQLISNYKKRPDLPLIEFNEQMGVTAHASPDAGWPNLQPFLARTTKQLTIGMYEFTAPHIVNACTTLIKPNSRHVSLVLQNRDEQKKGTTANDLTEQETVDKLTAAAGKRLSFAWASVSGPNRLFATSYHIKVAVRDGQEFWLSSGSWRSSNQPPFDPIKNGDQTPPLIQQYDRDWHVLVSHPGLAGLFEKHLLRDEQEAAAVPEALLAPEPEFWVPEAYFRATDEEARVAPKYHPPLSVKRKVRVQPLLTPDNYAEHVLPLIQNARKSLYFQNQSLDAKQRGQNGDVYEALLDALLKKQKDPSVDVRIIFRNFPTVRQSLTGLKDFGFDTSLDKIRVQMNCHTKGIVIDGEIVLIGSQNWTRAGTTLNRDASLIFFDPEIAKYYEDLFMFDWNRIAQVRIDESIPAAALVRTDEGVPAPGRFRVSAHELLGD
jgi:PLD-like domain/Trypsin-like peptidase domain